MCNQEKIVSGDKVTSLYRSSMIDYKMEELDALLARHFINYLRYTSLIHQHQIKLRISTIISKSALAIPHRVSIPYRYAEHEKSWQLLYGYSKQSHKQSQLTETAARHVP